MEMDPVCGMQVEKSAAVAKVTYLDRTYYFCSSACHKAFTTEPEKYTKAAARESGPGSGTNHRG